MVTDKCYLITVIALGTVEKSLLLWEIPKQVRNDGQGQKLGTESPPAQKISHIRSK